MSPDEDELPSDGEAMLDDEEGVSHQRVRRTPSPAVLELLADFMKRSEGLAGADLEREFERLVDQIVERSVGIAPVGMREQVRETLRSYIEHDPTLSSMVNDLRSATRR